MSSKPSDSLSPILKTPPKQSKAPTSSDSDSESDDEQDTFHDASTHFSPQDEATLLSESNTTKSEANALFSEKRYSEAISTYDRALSSCPNYLEYEIAVLKSNISACHLQLEDWKHAIDSATEALDGLDRLDPPPKQDKDKRNKPNSVTKSAINHAKEQSESDAVVEIPSDEDESTALHRLSLSDSRLRDISRIRLKSLLRRAKARHRLSTWSSLVGAQEDYNLSLSLLTTTNHTQRIKTPSSSSDLDTVRHALHVLPTDINKSKEKEMGEMMGKLKELGNGILKPFGLSTDNFNMVKDERTGGYSMNFDQGAGGGGGRK